MFIQKGIVKKNGLHIGVHRVIFPIFIGLRPLLQQRKVQEQEPFAGGIWYANKKPESHVGHQYETNWR
ncbi:hypothetical protein D478_07613 [Brevibacillus agri BAB-2500]|nr:hypothetical protein D478_07613 [Brevibacillus agri BAB-2500]